MGHSLDKVVKKFLKSLQNLRPGLSTRALTPRCGGTYAGTGRLCPGPFRLDVRDERLWQGQDVLPLRHKTLRVLHALVARAGHLLTKRPSSRLWTVSQASLPIWIL